MSQNKTKNRIFSILIIILILIVVFFGMRFFGKKNNNDKLLDERNVTNILEADIYEKINIENDSNEYDEISSLYICKNNNEKITGYVVFAEVNGKNDKISLGVAFDDKCEKVKNISVFDGGFDEKNKQYFKSDKFKQLVLNESLPINTNDSSFKIGYNDGTYKLNSDRFNDDGFRTEVTIKVSDGKIKDVIWDELDKDGNSKKNKSIKGEYFINDSKSDNLRWHEQAELAEKEIIKIQNPTKINIDENGVLSDIKGFTIDAREFIFLCEKCIDKAKSDKPSGVILEKEYEENSKAIINGINISAEFVKGNFSG